MYKRDVKDDTLHHRHNLPSEFRATQSSSQPGSGTICVLKTGPSQALFRGAMGASAGGKVRLPFVQAFCNSRSYNILILRMFGDGRVVTGIQRLSPSSLYLMGYGSLPFGTNSLGTSQVQVAA